MVDVSLSTMGGWNPLLGSCKRSSDTKEGDCDSGSVSNSLSSMSVEKKQKSLLRRIFFWVLDLFKALGALVLSLLGVVLFFVLVVPMWGTLHLLKLFFSVIGIFESSCEKVKSNSVCTSVADGEDSCA